MGFTPQILLVDRDADESTSYAARFRGQGFCTLRAHTAADACRFAEELRPAVAILDFDSFGADESRALARRLRSLPAVRPLPIIAISERDSGGARDVCDLVMGKPCEPDRLVSAAAGLMKP